jgi:hypothetical protein
MKAKIAVSKNAKNAKVKYDLPAEQSWALLLPSSQFQRKPLHVD